MTVVLRETSLGRVTRRLSRTAARRAVGRWAWRMFRREWRRQALVLVLLLVAVAATVFGLGVVTTAAGVGPSPVFGTANTIVEIPGNDPTLSSDIAAVRARFGNVDVVEHQSIPVPGSVSTVDLRAEDPHGTYDRVTLRVDNGRFPAAPSEVAVTHEVANDFGLRVGGTWNPAGRQLLVVGIVENPLDLLDQFALVPPGQIGSPAQVSVMLDADFGALRSFHLASGVGVGIGGRGHQQVAAAQAVVLVLGTLGLTFVGLIAVAGFAVLANRRLRALGMLGSLGATSRHIRWVMLANGAAVGATASLLGVAAGVLGWIAFSPTLQSMIHKHVDRFSLPWWAVGAAAVLATLTALLAAWWPARAAARISVIAALSGRPPRPQPSHRFAASGGVVSAAGIVLLAFADQRRAGFIIAGTVLTVAGVLILAPLAIRGLAAAGRRSTIAARLALRDLVRYQARSGAALGAITLAVGISATIAISAAAADTPTGPGNLPSNQMMVYLTPAGLGMDQIPPVDEAQQQALSAAVARLASSIGAVSTVPLEQAYDPTSGIGDAQPGGPASGGQPAGYATASLAEIIQRPHGEEITSPNTIYVATPAVLSHYGLQPSQVGPATDVVTGRTDLSGLQVFSPAGKSDPSLTTTQLRPHLQIDKQLPAYTSAPDILLTEHAMQEMGLQPIFAGWLIQTPGSLTSSQIATARQDAATVGLYVETRKPQSSNAALVNWSTTAGILLALGVLAMTVGLIRSETANDLRTLTATGASRRTRRALTSFTAGALAFLGASVGVAGSYAALLAWHRSDLAPLGRVPVANLVVILACLPVAAAAGGWLLAGRQPSAISRQPVE